MVPLYELFEAIFGVAILTSNLVGTEFVLVLINKVLVVVDFWFVFGVENFIHEFFSGLLQFLNEGGILVFDLIGSIGVLGVFVVDVVVFVGVVLGVVHANKIY